MTLHVVVSLTMGSQIVWHCSGTDEDVIGSMAAIADPERVIRVSVLRR